MNTKDTLNDFKNQLSCQQMMGEVAMDVRRLSFEDFRRKAREHQIDFRKNELGVGFYKYPNVLKLNDAKKGLIFFEGFRKEILDELKKPVAPTSTVPSGQMLTNLLRSEHIPYNIFFPMRNDLEGCKRLLNKILGREEIASITDIIIEYHPEPPEEYLDDRTAFDVYIPYLNRMQQPCGIGIEVKYTEKEYPLKRDSKEYRCVNDDDGHTRLSGAYLSVTRNCGYYKDDVTDDVLVSNKFRQIWRNHILGASMVLRGVIANFISITLYPQENIHFSLDAMPKYKALLRPEHYNSFVPISYENLFAEMETFLNLELKEEWMAYLRRRYLFNCLSGF